MNFPWYIITGEVNVDNFTKLLTKERGFIWRGFTHEYEMKPSAANYDRYGEKVSCQRTEPCHPLAEIRRVAEKIYQLNKLRKFPFEIPLSISNALFPKFYQPEDKFFKDMNIKEFPNRTLAQAMSIVQHECGGTTLLDFSTNKYTALYFAIGNKEETLSQDSWIFGLNIPWFETQKDNPTTEIFDKDAVKFDIIYPSYFMNNKIAHQEGMFLYQKFDVSCSNINKEYKNIIDFFESYSKEDKYKKYGLYEKINIDKFFKITEIEHKPIFYVLLKVPATEKSKLKVYLDTIGVTDTFMTDTLDIDKISKKTDERSA